MRSFKVNVSNGIPVTYNGNRVGSAIINKDGSVQIIVDDDSMKDMCNSFSFEIHRSAKYEKI